MRWLNEIGYSETNPATLAYFAYTWKIEFKGAINSLSSLGQQIHEIRD